MNINPTDSQPKLLPVSASLLFRALLWSLCIQTVAKADIIQLDAIEIPKVAIIIDDIGYNYSEGLKAAQFPGALTLSVLPFGPNSQELAEVGHHHGKEIMLHAPMSTILNQPLDKGGLTENMDHDTFLRTLRTNIQAIPYLTGLNNHMGSGLTQHQQSMEWLMAELKLHKLFFIDSRTTPASIAADVAKQYEIPNLSRDIFLDHERTTEAVAKQFELLIKIARTRGAAIAIGHPNKVTMDFLASQSSFLNSNDIKLVSISELLPNNHTPFQQEPIPEDFLPPEQIIY